MNQKPKIGQGSLRAFMRQGIKELGRALQALPTSIPFVEEPGQIGTATTQAVSQQTGVSQPVQFSQNNVTEGLQSMNAQEPTQAEVTVNQPQQASMEASQQESVLDSLMENAKEMAAEQERQQEVEIEP